MVLTAMAVLMIGLTACTQPAASPAVTEPPPVINIPPALIVRATPDEAYYLPGQLIDIQLSFSSLTTVPLTLNPYPPEIQIKPRNQDKIMFSIPADSQSLEVKPNDVVTMKFTWDQKDNKGNQVPPGWYDLVLKGYTVTSKNLSIEEDTYIKARLLFQYPQGAIEKSLDLNQSQTINGVTVTLERVELTSTGINVYVFNTPPGYIPPPPSTLPASPFLVAFAQYGVDGSAVKQAGSPQIRFLESVTGTGMRFLEKGGRYTWMKLNPVPSDAKELVFRIRMSFNDKPEESLGPWEFKIPLE